MKKRTKKFQNLLKNKDFVYFIICLFLLVTLLALQFFLEGQSVGWPKKFADLIEVDMLVSVVVAFLLTSLAATITRMFVGCLEDVTKLTDEYDKLVKMYEANTEMLLCRNSVDSYNKKGRKTACRRVKSDLPGDTYRIPVGDVVLLRGREVVIDDDPDDWYSPPNFCRTHYSELLNAHDFSNTYNQTTLRVKNFKEENGKVHISFSRSTYYDALVSNRAIDFKIGGLCVRDVCAQGPFLTTLEDSLLSNHMGFNGMVETADGKFVFVKRHKRVSIGKNTMQCSVAASLKAKYALNKEGRLTKEGIARAIMMEIEDELALSKTEKYNQKKSEIFGDFSFENNVLYFYRDLLEGGKPQLMFYAKLNILSSDLEKAYRKENRKSPLQKDGNTIRCVDINELRKIYLAPNKMVIENRCNPAMPSAVATVVMLKQAMAQGLIRDNVQESFTLSKKGDQNSNEDAVYADDRFIAVIDGATAKTAPPEKATMSSGRFAAQTICDLLAVMPDETDTVKMLTWLNNNLKQAIAGSVFAESFEGPLASLILYDSRTKTVISYGDCQARLRGDVYKQEKTSDILLAKKRADILQAALDKGVPAAKLLQHDIGRAEIQDDILAYSSQYANKQGDGFPVLGRGEIVEDYIIEYPVDSGETIILASDGYPVLADTLAQSEANLDNIIKKDPLLIHQYQSTKGVRPENVSYDDRTYIRFTVK